MIGDTGVRPMLDNTPGQYRQCESEARATSRTLTHPRSPMSVGCALPQQCRPRWGQSILLAMIMAAGSPLSTSDSEAQIHVSQRITVPPAEAGLASWYGHPYHGRRAASGEVYDMRNLTGAHRTLPFGTHVRVHSLENYSSVDVEINDRGPFVEGRIIDISRAAALALGFGKAGMIRVYLEVLSPSPRLPVVN